MAALLATGTGFAAVIAPLQWARLTPPQKPRNVPVASAQGAVAPSVPTQLPHPAFLAPKPETALGAVSMVIGPRGTRDRNLVAIEASRGSAGPIARTKIQELAPVDRAPQQVEAGLAVARLAFAAGSVPARTRDGPLVQANLNVGAASAPPDALLASSVAALPGWPESSISGLPRLGGEDDTRVTAGADAASHTLHDGASGMAAIAEQGVDSGAGATAQSGPLHYYRSARGVEFEVSARVNGAAVGNVPLLIADQENVLVRLADILAVLEPMMDKAQFDALHDSDTAQEFVTFNTLRAAGIAVAFDAHDQLILGSR